jgi:hypothetical protein
VAGVVLTAAAWTFCLALLIWNIALLVEFAAMTSLGLRTVMLNNAYELRDNTTVLVGQIIVPSISITLVHTTRFYQQSRGKDSLVVKPIHKVEIRDNLQANAMCTSNTSATPLVRAAVSRVKVPLNTADDLMFAGRISSMDSVSVLLSELLARTQDLSTPLGASGGFFSHKAHLIVSFDREQLNAVRACQVSRPDRLEPYANPAPSRSFSAPICVLESTAPCAPWTRAEQQCLRSTLTKPPRVHWRDLIQRAVS